MGSSPWYYAEYSRIDPAEITTEPRAAASGCASPFGRLSCP